MDHRPPACGLASSSPSDHAQAAGEAEEVQRIDNALRRSIRLANLAVATETTWIYLHSAIRASDPKPPNAPEGEKIPARERTMREDVLVSGWQEI